MAQPGSVSCVQSTNLHSDDICPSIRDHVGESLETHISELDNVLELSKDNMVRTPEVELSPNVTLTPDDYLKVETVLLDILKLKCQFRCRPRNGS